MTTLDDAITALNAAVTTLNTTANTGYAQAVASAITQANTATTQAGIATTKAGEASSSAIAAAASAASINPNNIDINGGTIDGTVIGGAVPAAGSFTTLSATSGSASVASFVAQGGGPNQGVYQFGTANTAYSIQGGADYSGLVFNVADISAQVYAFKKGATNLATLTSTGLSVTGGISATAGDNLDVSLLTLASGVSVGNKKSIAWTDSLGTLLAKNSFVFGAGGIGKITWGSIYNAGVASSDLMTLDASGNLGLGVVPSGAVKLEVGGSMSATGSLTVGSFTAATRPAHSAGKMIYVSDGGAGAVFQGSNGSAWVNLG